MTIPPTIFIGPENRFAFFSRKYCFPASVIRNPDCINPVVEDSAKPSSSSAVAS
nr:MAG TPA: hypothetical protein [Caudoviricetes sp.]